MAGLPAGKTIRVRSPRWTALGRRHTVQVTVDARSVVAESNEANNELAQKFEVRGRRPKPRH